MASYPICKLDEEFHRLIPSRFPPVPLYERLGSQEIQAVATTLEARTNPRLREEERLAKEAKGQPNPNRTQNWNLAPFAYPNPEGTTFLDPSYRVLELVAGADAALAIAIQRRESFLQATSEPPISVEMRTLVRRVTGKFADLIGFPIEHDQDARWKLGSELYETEIQGMVYQHPDLPGARSVTVFDGAALGRALQSDHYRFLWDGNKICKIGNFSTHEVLTREELFAKLIPSIAA